MIRSARNKYWDQFNPWVLLFAALLLLFGLIPSGIMAEENQDSISIMQSFSQDQDKKSEIVQIKDQEKREIMFFMGIPLIIMLIITAGLGVAMVVYRKRVFVPHMIFAGLSLTLALGHAVVGTVWFYPF